MKPTQTYITGLLVAGQLLFVKAALQGASSLQFGSSTYTVEEEAGAVTLTVQRLEDLDTIVSVDYASNDGTATAGLKYTAVSGTLTFGAGETSRDITVPILNDAIVGNTTAFTVILGNPTGGAALGLRTNATVRINDNDKGLVFEFANYWAREDEGSVLVGVVRADDGDFPVTVDVATMNTTAQAGLDYAGVTNTLTFAVGETIKLFTIPILNDGLKEANEIFRLILSNSTGGGVVGVPRSATVNVVDNDPGVGFTPNQLWIRSEEGAAVLTVARGNDRLLDSFTVDYATTNRTATAGADYTETKGTLTFAAGEMARCITVPFLESGAAQPDRQFKVVLSNPTSGMLLGPSSNLTATVTVFDTREMSPHQFDVCQVASSGTVTLTLGGGFTPGLGLSNRLQPYYDIYPLEVSSNLTDWASLTWVVRTSALTNPLSCVDTEAQFDSQRFYRTPAATFVTPQRAPSGPYPVGVTDRTIRDDNRRNRYRISTNGSFPITIWYPARRIPGQWPTAYEPASGTRDPRVWTGWTDRVPYCHSHSLSNAPFASGLWGLPVALWSHGYPDRRYDGQEWAEHLASHGYVVVAVDHADSSVVVYPDGRYIFTDFNDLTGRDSSDQLRQDRVRDFIVVLNELAGWNERDDLFAGRIDVQNAAAIGWSYGGGVAAEFCRVDSRARAAVVLEGYFQNVETLLAVGLTKPVLSMYQASSSDARLFNKLTQDAVWFQIRYAEHPNFCGDYWCFASTTLERSREAARTITDYMLWFLNKYLKGSQNPMPDPAAYPQVFNFKRK